MDSKQMELRAKYRDHEKKEGFNALHLSALFMRARPDANPYHVALDAAEVFKLAKSKAALAVAQYGEEATYLSPLEYEKATHRAVMARAHALGVWAMTGKGGAIVLAKD